MNYDPKLVGCDCETLNHFQASFLEVIRLEHPCCGSFWTGFQVRYSRVWSRASFLERCWS